MVLSIRRIRPQRQRGVYLFESTRRITRIVRQLLDLARPGLAVAFISVHYYRISRLHGISLPASEEESPDAAARKEIAQIAIMSLTATTASKSLR